MALTVEEVDAVLRLKDEMTPQLKTSQASLASFGASARATGGTMTKFLTLPILAAGAAALAASETYDEAMRAIQVGTGATGAALESINASFDKVFASVPDGAAMVGTALADVNTITGATGGVLEDLTTNLLDISRVMGGDANANAIDFARALEQFQEPAEAGSGILDTFAAVSQRTGISLSGLIGNTKTFGSVLKNAGFSMEQSAALFGSLSKAGIEATRVMPGLNAAFRNWAKEGLDSRDMLAQVIDKVKMATTDTEALSIATEAFGAEGAQRMTVAIRTGAFALENFDTILQGTEGTVAAATASNQTLGEMFAELKNNVVLALQPFGKDFREALDQLIPLAVSMAQKLGELARWFTTLSPKTKVVTGVIVALAAAAGPVLIAVGAIASGVSALLPILAVLKVAMLAIFAGAGAPFVIAAAVIVGLVVVWKKWGKDITRIVSETSRAIKTWLVDKFGGIIRSIKSKIDAVVNVFKSLKEKIVGRSIVPEMIQGIGREMNRLKTVMTGPAKEATDAMTSAFKLTKEETERFTASVQGLVDRFSGAGVISQALEYAAAVEAIGGTTKLTTPELEELNRVLETALEKYKALGQEAPAALAEMAMAVDETLLASQKSVEEWVQVFADATNAQKPLLMAYAHEVDINLLQAQGHMVKTADVASRELGKDGRASGSFSEGMQAIVDFVSKGFTGGAGILSVFKGGFREILDRAKQGFGKDGLKGLFKGGFEGLVHLVTQGFMGGGGILSIFTKGFGGGDGLEGIVKRGMNLLRDLVKGGFHDSNAILDKVRGGFEAMKNITTNAWTAMSGIFRRGWERIKQLTQAARGPLVDIFRGIFDVIKGALETFIGFFKTSWSSFMDWMLKGVGWLLGFFGGGGSIASAVSSGSNEVVSSVGTMRGEIQGLVGDVDDAASAFHDLARAGRRVGKIKIPRGGGRFESFQHGGRVKRTGFAFVHQGETVNPAGQESLDLHAVLFELKRMNQSLRDLPTQVGAAAVLAQR